MNRASPAPSLTATLVVTAAVTLLTPACKIVGPETRLENASDAATACVQMIRAGYPADWSIERVLDQRVLKDDWGFVPPCPDVPHTLADVTRLLPDDHPFARYEVPPVVPLTEDLDDLAIIGKLYRRIDSILTDIRLENGMQPRPLPLAGSPIPGVPKPTHLNRWPTDAEDYRTLTWPLASGLLVLETVRLLPGQGDCPAGGGSQPAAQCYRYATTWIQWDGKAAPRAMLEVPSPGATFWTHWDAAPDGRLYALGVVKNAAGSAAMVGSYAAHSTAPTTTPLTGELATAKKISATADGVLLHVEIVTHFAPHGDGPLAFEPADRPPLGRQRVTGTPMSLSFADESSLDIEQRRRVLVAKQMSVNGQPTTAVRIAELYGELGHLNYAAADSVGRVALAFTHPSALATSLLFSQDGGATWGGATAGAPDNAHAPTLAPAPSPALAPANAPANPPAPAPSLAPTPAAASTPAPANP